MITIVGLGVEAGDVSLKGLRALKEADEVLVRTGALSSVEGLKAEGVAFSTLDHLYEKSRNYDTLAKNIAREVTARAKDKNVCYCVDGDASEDRAARLLMQKRGVKVVEGLSKAAAFASKAGLQGKYTAISAFDVAEGKLALPLVVYDLTEDVVGDIKLLLAEKYGDEAPACFLCGKNAIKIPLYEADRQESYTEAALVLYDTPLLEKKRFDFEDFVAILSLLRAPDGCPWDRVQTHESIRINAIEEAYELVDAIDLKDVEKMREEAGDVLMQAVFHTLIEQDKGGFTVTDMLSEVCLKLISRHTHVFGKDAASSADGALVVWEQNKMKEKHQETFSDAINDVPQCFPALLRAQKIAKRAQKGGWDKPTFERFEKKFAEEYRELREAYAEKDEKHIAEEMGDVLLTVVELGRAVGADCEQALLDAAKKVQARYTAYEGFVRADGKDVLSLTEEEKNAYYKKAKDATQKA